MATMQEGNPNNPFYNLQREPKPLTFTSKMEKEANQQSADKLKKSVDRLTQKVLNTSTVKMDKNPATSMKERYELAWGLTYKKLPEWRQREIDASRKDGTFGEKHYDQDFVRQVALLAESDDPLRA